MTRTPMILAFLYALLSASLALAADDQQIVIELTDKQGNPRKNVALEYDVLGVNTEKNNSTLILLEGQHSQTDENGVLTVPVAPIASLLQFYGSGLNNSKQIEVHIYPYRSSEPLASIKLKFLLGTAPQNMKIVMMRAKAYRTSQQIARAAYEGINGRFHLLGSIGTALYIGENGRYTLAQLERHSIDENYFYYREANGSGVYWAFSRNCSERYSYCGCGRKLQCLIWMRKPGINGEWRIYESAERIDVEQPGVIDPLSSNATEYQQSQK